MDFKKLLLKTFETSDIVGLGLLTFGISYFVYSVYTNYKTTTPNLPSAPQDKLTEEQLKIFNLKNVYRAIYGYFPSEDQFTEWYVNERAKRMVLRSATETLDTQRQEFLEANWPSQDVETSEVPNRQILPPFSVESKETETPTPEVIDEASQEIHVLGENTEVNSVSSTDSQTHEIETLVSSVNRARRSYNTPEDYTPFTEEDLDDLFNITDSVIAQVDYKTIIQAYIDKGNSNTADTFIPRYNFEDLFKKKFGPELDDDTDTILCRVGRYANPSLIRALFTGENRLPFIVETLSELFSDEEIAKFLQSLEWLNS